MRLRPLDPDRDRAHVEALWLATIAPTWPVLPAGIDRLRTGFVAIDDGDASGGSAAGGEVVGMVAASRRGTSVGVQLVMVAPHRQRRGIGTALLDAALDGLPRGTRAHAGHGGEGYIWPGAPLDLPAGPAFLTARGWRHVHDCADLTQDLREHRPALSGVSTVDAVSTVDTVEAGDPEVLAFEAEHFPEWLRHYENTTWRAAVARDGDGRIVGALLFGEPGPEHPLCPMLGPSPGTIACVGVAAHAHGRGIGSAMVAHASRVLRDGGTRVCLIDWVVRESFYARLGYHAWRRYGMYDYVV